ncbi:MAG: sulfotransferase [Chloroflexota bacterium]|nr:sulfotransferase [Chloroflexota bacterium]MDE2961751.1 sulfotransferase [Chloroflexota bacterium]
MASPRLTNERSETGRSWRLRRVGYRPGEPARSATFASGFNSFLTTGKLSLALRLGFKHGVDREFTARYLGLLFCNALFAPMRLWQSMAYSGRIARQELHPEPLFLLGFWRSGTTLLHNLLSMDPHWGFVNTYQAAMPDVFLAGQNRVRRMIEKSLPANRGVDNIPVDFSMPQEEEIAMMCSSGLSPYAFLHFPRTAEKALDYLFIEERLDAREQAEWKREFTRLLKTASYHMGGKPLLLKSPSNTSRIMALLELFPSAKFVYIQRDPYDTVRSYERLIRLMNDWHALQRADFDELLTKQLEVYRDMALAYLEQRELIPEGRLVEIRYEELEQDKIGQVKHIYDALGLGGHAEFEERLAEYVASIEGFEKNPSYVSDRVIAAVNEYVPFLVEEYGYDPRAEHGAGA